MSVKESIVAMRDNIRKQKDELRAKVQETFHAEAKAIFERHPTLEGFRWTQYTPYFNDGDACTFGSHAEDPQFKFSGEKSADEDADEDGYEDMYSSEIPEQSAAIVDVKEFLGAFDDDDYLGLFDDHKEVTVTRNGIEVDDYEHD